MSRMGLACLLSAVVILGAVHCNSSEPGQEPAPEATLRTAVSEVTGPRCSTCLDIHLGDYNLFLLEDYSGGGNVAGKVAAGGNITLNGFSLGFGLPDDNVFNTLVAGKNLRLSNYNVFGATWYGESYTPDWTVNFRRGPPARGTPIDFVARFAELRSLSSRLATQPAHGTVRRETWNALTLTGTDECLNVFTVSASDFTGTTQRNLFVPAGSFALINIHGTGTTLTGGFNEGLNPQRVLYNFVDATRLDARGVVVPGTVLAPHARVTFSGGGGWAGGIYAVSLSGSATGNLRPLDEVAGATAEVCNETDDNCNGQVDEGFECTGSGSRSCTDPRCGAEGTQSCNTATCGYGACISPSCCEADADCASGSYCEGSRCTAQLENGDTCTRSNQCANGPCVDGVCCNSACEGECDACNLTGLRGTCSPAPATVQCRATGGACDVAEYCTGSSATCPADAKKPATTQCRDSGGVCDVVEFCTGSSNDCPEDGHASNTTECRGPAGVCDEAERCTGSSAECPADGKKPVTTQCRGSAGVCDVEEFCTGSGNDCPADGYAAPTTQCRASAGECDVAESCTGTGASCPANGFAGAGAACTGDSNVCTGDVCDGAGSCSHPPAPPATVCGTSYAPWGNCAGFSDYCDTTGTQSRTVTASTCGAGTCSPSSSTVETQACTREAPDMTCAAPVYGEWSECSYSNLCAQTGTQRRTVTSSVYSCASGRCEPSTRTETQACTRSTAGVLCRAAGVCDRAEYCSGGTCPADERMPVGASCDDGNPGTTGETCDAAGACTSCGNGVRSGSEVCDDGNTVTESSCPYGQASCTRCNATCTQVVHLTGPYCGDWATNGPEACDNGTANGQSSCSYGQRFCSVCNGNCTGTQIVTGPYCGDGVTNGNEACDDGNEVTETSCPNGEGSCTVCNGTCTAPVQIRNCPSMTVMWNQAQPAWHLNPATRGTYECSGNVPMTGNGGSVGVMTNSPEREGSAAFTCNNGTWTVVPGSSTCNGTLTITKGPLVCYDRDTARRVLIGWYLTDLHRCADPGGLDWWTAQYKGNNGCGPYVPGVSEYDHVRNDCIRNGFRSGAVLEYPNAGHITRLAEMNACDSRAYAWDSFGASAPYPYPPNHFVGMYCKALPNWR